MKSENLKLFSLKKKISGISIMQEVLGKWDSTLFSKLCKIFYLLYVLFLCFSLLSPHGSLSSTCLSMTCKLPWETTQCCYFKSNINLHFFFHVLCHFNMGSCLDLSTTFWESLLSSQGDNSYPKCVCSFCKPY